MFKRALLSAAVFGTYGCSGLSAIIPAFGSADYFPLASGLVWTYDVVTTRKSDSDTPTVSKSTVKHRITSVENKGGIVTATLRAERGSSAPTHALERTPDGDIYSLITVQSTAPGLTDRESVALAPVIHRDVVATRIAANKFERDMKEALKDALTSAVLGSRAGSSGGGGGDPLPTETLRLFEGKAPAPGVSWDFQDDESSIHYKAASVQESVTTPAGTWENAVKITQAATKKTATDESISFYAAGVGLVKRSVKSNSQFFGVVSDTTTEMVLTAFSKQ